MYLSSKMKLLKPGLKDGKHLNSRTTAMYLNLTLQTTTLVKRGQ